ncbi:GerMN domain-containing protein [Treponema pallidum]|nr:GerMN domain-containing protein [Treponema pallidum]
MRAVCWTLLLIIGVALAVQQLAGERCIRYVLFFERMRDGAVVCEPRYVRGHTQGGAVREVVRELLLGPQHHGYARLVDPAVRPLSCFSRGDTLYIDLPVGVLSPKYRTCSLHRAYELFERSVVLNCAPVKRVCFYVGGRAGFESDG